jgi:ATP-binding cassette subfamily C (CFTR/MRP) protein 1
MNNYNYMMKGSMSNAGVAARRSPSRLIAFLVLALCIAVPTTAFATPVERASVFPLHSTKAVVSDATTTATTTTRPRHWKDGEYNNNASLVSRLVFNYVAPLLDIAAQRRLETDDAFHVPDNKSMERAVTRLEQIYKDCRESSQRVIMQQQQARAHESTATDLSSKRRSRWTLKSLIPFRKPSDQFSASETRVLSIALLKSQKDTLLLTGILRLLNTIVQAFPALLIARLLRQIESGNSIPSSQPLISALSLVSVLSVKMVVENQYFHNVVKCACEVRGSLSGMIFDKSLRLSRGVGDRKLSSTVGYDHKTKKKAKAKKKLAVYGSGGALNLMQSDAAIIEGLTMQLHTLWDGLLQISIYIALLYRYLGTPVIWGLSVLLATIPINAMILRILNRLNRRETEAKDARMKKTTESISNMQLLKLQSWESIFARDIENFREEELKRLTKRGAVRALNQAISFAVPTITLVATLFAYARMGKPIVASTIFTAISLFNQLRFPLLFYPMLIDSMANGKNSLRRISSYLAQEEIAPYLERYPKQLDGGRIEMHNGNFAWAAGSESDKEDVHTPRVPALIDANISVAPGEIVAVVGEVGSGKSALCKALIGELNPAPKTIVDKQMQHTEGVPRVIVQGSIAYCAQEAWLSKGTIRESVVFGREYDEKKYLRAIWAAGLDDDIVSTNFSAEMRATKAMLTHDTDVGEDGSNLSGGQRARVALARALYDENAGVYILDDVLSALDSSVGSTVFERVSSRLRQQKAAAIFVTNDPNLPRRCDKVILMGSQGASPGSRIVDVGSYDDLISRGHDLSTIVHPEEEDSDGDEDNGDVAYAVADDSVLHRQNDMQHDAKNTAPQPNEQAQKISTDDSMLTGAIQLRTYAAYFKSVASPVLILAAVASYFVSNGSQFFQQMVIARWTDLSPGAMASVSSEYLNKLVYTAVAVAVSMYFRSYLTMRVGVRASKSLHRKMLKSIFEAPLSFFSTTPSGQLLTRFGKELDVVDRSLPDVVASVMYCVLQILFSTLALTGVVTPLMAVPLCLVGVVYSKVTGRFRPAARDLKRCESKSRSPIYTHFREALRGAETIRSFAGGREYWSGKHRYLEDRNLSVFYSVKALDRWLSVRLESLGNVVVFTAAVASIFLTRHGHLKSGSAGWGLTQALSITGLLTVRTSCVLSEYIVCREPLIS